MTRKKYQKLHLAILFKLNNTRARQGVLKLEKANTVEGTNLANLTELSTELV